MPESGPDNIDVPAEVKVFQVKQAIDRLVNMVRNNEGSFANMDSEISEELINELGETKKRLDTLYDKQDATEEVAYLLTEYGGAPDPDKIMAEAGFDKEF